MLITKQSLLSRLHHWHLVVLSTSGSLRIVACCLIPWLTDGVIASNSRRIVTTTFIAFIVRKKVPACFESSFTSIHETAFVLGFVLCEAWMSVVYNRFLTFLEIVLSKFILLPLNIWHLLLELLLPVESSNHRAHKTHIVGLICNRSVHSTGRRA